MFTQLNPPLPVHVLGKGDGYAMAVIDYGQEHNLIWVTAIDATGEIWCAPNPQVRMHENWSMGRGPSPAVAKAKGKPKTEASHATDPRAAGLCADCAELVAD